LNMPRKNDILSVKGDIWQSTNGEAIRYTI
jgi:hypothetical protein